jgi:CBS domain-containing protein
MKTVKDILRNQLHNEVYSVLPDQNVLSAAQYMKFKNLGAVPVVQENRLLGVLSERDMLNKVVGPGLDPRDIPVEKIMTSSVLVTSLGETAAECLKKMRKEHCRHLPVVEKGTLVGMISLRDVLGIEETEFLDNYLWDMKDRARDLI